MKCFELKRCLLGLFFLGLGLFFLYQIHIFTYSVEPEPGSLSPMAFPLWLVSAWCVFSVLYIIIPRKPFTAFDVLGVLPVLGKIVASLLVYIVLIRYVGFICAGTVMLLAVFHVLNFRNWYGVLIATSSTTAIWLLFDYVMKMPMPRFELF